MKLAFLIQCHKSPAQINMLLEQLAHPDVDIYIHVDKKSNICDQITTNTHVHLLPDHLRIDVQWGTFSIVLSAINLLSYATQNGQYEYFWLISGQDFPIKSVHSILQFLQENKGNNFIDLCKTKYNGFQRGTRLDKRAELFFPVWMMNRKFHIRILRRLYLAITGGYSNTFYFFKRKNVDRIRPHFGSAWWCLYSDFVKYILDFIQRYPEDFLFFKNVLCSDESFFQTMLMNSHFAGSQRDYLHYIDWPIQASSPKNLLASDFNAIIQSGKFMTRKIDNNIELINLLKAYAQSQQ